MLLFTDITFWMVFVIFLTVYMFMRQWSRVGMLTYVTAFSLLYLYLADGWLMLLLPAEALVAWGMGRRLLTATRHRRAWLTAAVVLLLSPLVVFKYADFLLSSLGAALSADVPLLRLALPVGISFFTFQAVSYVVDVYRRRFTLRVTWLEFLFYLSFFPLLMAGPITRAGLLLPQLRRQRAVAGHVLYWGLWLVMTGLVKKCVVADYIAQYNDWIFTDMLTYSGLECAMGIVGYAVQIYCDFAGYSDLSIGIAALMGLRLADNFRFPYLATDVADFWHRWHISLSTWFRDYLYIPLGGNRRGTLRTHLNNQLTMLVAGLWHGASWMFVLWGGIHGVGLVVCRLLRPWLSRVPDVWGVRLLSRLLTFAYVAVAWVFFRSESVGYACGLLRRAVTDFDLAYLVPFVEVRPLWCLLVALPLLPGLVGERRLHRLGLRFVVAPWVVKLLLLSAVVQLVLQLRTASVQPFIYYQF